jgi:hypothetical protein
MSTSLKPAFYTAFVIAILLQDAIAAREPNPEVVALQFVQASMQGDLDVAESLVKEGAIHKGGEPGSVVAGLRQDWEKHGGGYFARIHLREVFFVRDNELERLERRVLRYYGEKREGNEVPDRIPFDVLRTRLGLSEGRTVGLFFFEFGSRETASPGFYLVSIEHVNGKNLVAFTTSD